MFNTVSLEIDFTENLKVPVKSEPQSMHHWLHEKVTIHSWTLKFNGEKSYNPYLSDGRKDDQKFVHICIIKETPDQACSVFNMCHLVLFVVVVVSLID